MLAYIDPTPVVSVGSALAGLATVLGLGLTLALAWLRRLGKAAPGVWKGITLAIAVLALAGYGIARLGGCGKQEQTNMTGGTYPRRVVVLGLDGLSPDILEPLLAEGKLPHFERLRRRGGYARLRTTNPPQSPVAWATFATGLRPGNHGVFDFIRRNPQTYMPEIGLTRMVKGKLANAREGKALWQYCSAKNVPVCILRVPVSFPPEEVKGTLLSGMGVPDVLGTQGTFSFYTTDKVDRRRDTGGEVYEVSHDPHKELRLYGPERRTWGGKKERTTVPFVVDVHDDGVHIRLPAAEFDLAVGQWSEWQAVVFKVDPFTRIRGCLKFLLVDNGATFKLYASPIGMDPRRPFHAISYPADYARTLADRIGLFSTRGMPFDTWALNEGRIDEDAFFAHAEQLLEENRKLLLAGLADSREGLFFCYFDYPDIMQHMCWRFLDSDHPLHPGSSGEAWGQRIEDIYRKMDDIVGLVLRQLGPDDALLAFSDHGFTSFRRAVHINAWLRDNGYQTLAAAEGRELLTSVDWSRTAAYAVGFGGIYLNLAGREARGIVAPGEQADALMTAMRSKLLAWKDPETGQTIVNEVYHGRDIFEGTFRDQAPDLYIGFKTNYRASWQTALGAAPLPQIEDNLKKWSGTHLVDHALVPGVLFSSQPLPSTPCRLVDLAPSILRLLGFKDEEVRQYNFDGESIF